MKTLSIKKGRAPLQARPKQSAHEPIAQDCMATVTKGEITLTPLLPSHINQYRAQIRDPNIAKLCNLPEFTSAQHWLTWYQQECPQTQSHTVFAVEHQRFGFIGSVSLEIHQGVGFFYYWFGREFQGRGFGPLAVTLLLVHGVAHYGLTCCYAKAYFYNMPSLKALEKMDFSQLPFVAQAPYDDELFFYWSPESSRLSLKGSLLKELSLKEPSLKVMGREPDFYSARYHELSRLLKTVDSNIQLSNFEQQANVFTQLNYTDASHKKWVKECSFTEGVKPSLISV
ncbi:GNAT family N-acetyltransferase [Marinibactrum halimedae]|uniref:N-acetyltransferase domain-containing protein n=1 Tax=Marinibactrum halimedae TaxID=1444977 RepID=A0AA37T119_9GAMM|nr:GNAT family protein [Marinibactrum halimedae]MCD9458071.1 GNAT family N-acetyltransferase [Marinibactrum halimedae]GLS25004.1 hypothetical protein GCM10007877_07180 [Marinibactrum halimedae]